MVEKTKPKKPTGRPKGKKDSREATRNKQDRKILDLYSKNTPIPAIAATVGCSVGTVWNRLDRFKIMLKHLNKL